MLMKGTPLFRATPIGLALIALLLTLLTACRPDADDEVVLLPENVGPGIAVLSPSNTRLLKRPGEAGSVVLKLLDNEQLRLLRIVKLIYDQRDSLVDEAIPEDIELQDQRVEYTYNFITPSLPAFYKVQYVCYAIDFSGRSAETFFWVSIQPDPDAPPLYNTLSYTNDTLWNGLDTEATPIDPNPSNKWGFNFSARRVLPDTLPTNVTLPQMDIAESDQTGPGDGQGSPFAPNLYSPNHGIVGDDTAIFVITDSTRFNYERANYNTIYQAFFSDPAPAPTAPPTNHPLAERNKVGLEVGDIVIVKLIKTPRPQFAVMRVKEIFREGFGVSRSDYMVFDYKVTTP